MKQVYPCYMWKEPLHLLTSLLTVKDNSILYRLKHPPTAERLSTYGMIYKRLPEIVYLQ